MNADPYRIEGPAVISVSGGRTSAYMLKQILDRHGGTLPDRTVALFANTGRELDGTIDFVRAMEVQWGQRIIWLEYRRQPQPGARALVTATVVNHETASRNGEPFDMLLAGKRIVPDPTRRFCTEQLKIRTISRFCRHELGWTHWTNVVGYRADETARVEKKQRDAVNGNLDLRFATRWPLYDAGITEFDIRRFWDAQSFDLKLPRGAASNCDGCFLKTSEQLGRMFQLYPERMAWWPQQEQRYGPKTFYKGYSYRDIEARAKRNAPLPWDDGQLCAHGCGV